MSGFVLDQFDREIISLLQKDGRMPFLTIANELGLSLIHISEPTRPY